MFPPDECQAMHFWQITLEVTLVTLEVTSNPRSYPRSGTSLCILSGGT